MSRVTVYGADWCGDTRRALEHLSVRGVDYQYRGVDYQYRDVDQDPQALAWVEGHNGGKRKLPTVRVGDAVLSVPTPADLDRALGQTSGPS